MAPEGSTQKLELLGQGPHPLEILAQILLEYHNGPLGGHLGADKTARRIMKDWYWPGIFADVDQWIRMCDFCRRGEGICGDLVLVEDRALQSAVPGDSV